MPADRTQETIFVGKRVLTQAGLDARHQRAMRAVKWMERRRQRMERQRRLHEFWKRMARMMKGGDDG